MAKIPKAKIMRLVGIVGLPIVIIAAGAYSFLSKNIVGFVVAVVLAILISVFYITCT